MQSSISDIDPQEDLQELKNLRPQLYSAVEYFLWVLITIASIVGVDWNFAECNIGFRCRFWLWSSALYLAREDPAISEK